MNMKQPYPNLRPAAGVAVCAVLLFVFPPTGRAADHYLLSTHVPPPVANGLKSTGHLPDTNQLYLSIGLPMRDQAGLDAFLQQIYDPKSPNYRHYLTVAQFADKFGPTVADYEALRAFAKSNGLTENKTYENRLVLSVRASVADIRKALHLNILTYEHPTENRTFYAPDKEPTMDFSIPVLHIAGLDNYQLPRPADLKLGKGKLRRHGPIGSTTQPWTNQPNPSPNDGSGLGGSYISADFRNAYAPGVGLNGAGQSVGLLEFDTFYPSDILYYQQTTGLPPQNVVIVPVDGGATTPDGGEPEVSLDIEMAMAMAPNLDAIYVFETSFGIGTGDDLLSSMASAIATKQFSSSWSFGGDAETDNLYKEMAAQGQTVFFASGDRGAFDGANGPGGFGPQSSESPYFILVGGTQLEMNGLGVSYASESVWGTGQYVEDENWGSSGGICTFYPIPSYQQGINMTVNKGSTVYRNSPDVALTAIGIYQDLADGYYTTDSGGTSAASPLWAGYNAMINQQAAIYGLPPDGFINPAIYSLAKGPNYAEYFHDITVGNNTWPGSPSLFYAVTGYDLCTGWGTPTGSNIINALEPPMAVPVLVVQSESITSGNGSSVLTYDDCANVTFLITNQGRASGTGIQGFLYSTTLGAIVAQSIVTFPDLPPGTEAYSSASFTLSTEPSFICGTPIDLVLVLKYDQGIETNSIELPTGIIGPPVVFANATPYVIPEGNLTGIISPVTVSNLQAADKITVSVYATAVYDGGLNMRLTGPNGTNVVLTAYPNGYEGANFGSGCSTNEQTTFDDDAVTPVTMGTAPFVGSYQPEQPLSTFLPLSGTNLNGVWQLTVTDEITGNPAELVCWSLNVTPYDCLDGGGQCPGSVLSLSMTASPTPVLVTSNVVFNLTVSNAGPSEAADVVISQTLPPGFVFVTTSNYPAQVTPGSNLLLSLGGLPDYGSATISVVTTPTLLIGSFPDLATSTATVGTTGINPYANNSIASASVVVTLPMADLAVSMSASPVSLLQGGLVTYTIVVTNNGPYTATGVVLTNTIPAGATFVSSTTSQGTVAQPGVQFDLGSVPVGTNAVITVTVSPTTVGNITDTAQIGLGPLETDPVTVNNTASSTITVGPSAELEVSAVVTPGTVIAGNNSTYVATVLNNGPSTASSVVFNQTIPGGTGANADTFVSSSVAGVTVTNGNITWNIGTMTNGEVLHITNVLKTPTIQGGGTPIVLSSTFSVFGQPGDANTNYNVFTVSNLAEVPTITIVPVGATLVSQSGGFSNGAVNPGETVGVQFYLQNTGNVPTTNLQATLLSTGGVSLVGGNPQNYGALQPGGAAVGGAFTFLASGSNGGTIVASLALQDGSASRGTNTFTFNLPMVQTFWNTNPIYIPGTNYYASNFDSGPGAPYPSTIQVSNITGFVSKVTATVSNLSHTYPHDIGLLLVGPGTNSVLMDHVAEGFSDLTGATLTFDSTSTTVLPLSGSFTSGTYEPVYYSATYNPTDVFTNAVAPPGSSNALNAPPYNTNLTSFNGLAANGLWTLYSHDDAQGDVGGISNGWAVTITTIVPVNPTNGLAASIVASTNQVVQGGTITYLYSVTNNGAATVTAYLTNILPAGLSFVSSSLTNYTANGTTNLYSLGSLSPGLGLTITNVEMAVASGLPTTSITNTISAGLPVTVFNIGANSASVITTLKLPLADLAAGISVAPTSGVVTSNVTYTLSVTNLGPSNSVATLGAFPLAGLSLVTVTPPNYTNSNGTVLCSLGTIPVGSSATVTILATPTNAGTLTNVWTVSNASDTNSVTNLLTVNNPAPMIAALGATLLTREANGSISTNSTNTVAFTLINEGYASTSNLVGTLLAVNGITNITPVQQSYGAIPIGGTATESFSFTVAAAPGSNVTAVLALTDGTNFSTNISFTPFFVPITVTYSNTIGISIPQGAPNATEGPASPYPSPILVSMGTNLLVSQVTVTLTGFAHTFPHDVNVLLDSPSGQELILMGHAGGAFAATNVNLTFADAATQYLPVGQLVTGTSLPTDYSPVDIFPGLPPASGESALAFFNGMGPNGYWSLYVYDDTVGNSGFITGGWSLGLTAVNPVNPAALLTASMVSSPNPVFSGDYLNYQITITNQGPDIASSVVITDTLPAGVTYSSATLSQGTNTVTGGTVVCSLGSIRNGATATATIRVIAGAPGAIVNTATVTTASADLYLAASTTANTTTVQASPRPELSASIVAGGLQLTLLGQVDQNYAIQISSNLLNWTSVFTNTASIIDGTFIFTDTQTNAPQRFYRAVQLPQ